jgi:chitin disaccharide deacetylase
MKYLIVNGDDLGAGAGINRGILEAHRNGILTSASLMVNMPGSVEAAELARAAPGLSVGLHVDLSDEGGASAVDLADMDACRRELGRQLERCRTLLGKLPTHIDSHHNIHRRNELRPLFVELARTHGIPLREHSAARYFSSFYGQWSGESHLEHIGVDSLCRMLRDEVGEGVTELACHPGLPDPEFQSGYSVERETEVRTLCDPAVRAHLATLGIRLIGFRDLARIAAAPAAERER